MEARRADLRVDADGAEEQARDPAHQPLQHRGAHRRERGQAEHHQREIFRRPEGERRARERRREQHEADRADGAGDERADRRDAERHAAAALQRHLVAVERGHHRGRLARHVDQHRSERAAVHGAVVKAGEHDESAGRIEAARERQQQRNGEGGPNARQNSDDGAESHSNQRPQEIGEGQGGRKAEQQLIER